MARYISLGPGAGTLITRVRQRADLEADDFVSDAEITSYLNDSYPEFWDLLTADYEGKYLVNASSTTLHVTSSVDTYSLPSDFYKLVGVDYQVTSGSQFLPLTRADWSYRNALSLPYFIWGATLPAPGFGYTLLGTDTIKMLPVPRSGPTLRVWYIPCAPLLTGSGDQVNGINGFEEYMVLDAAIKCRLKEESDISGLEMRKEQIKDRIIKMRAERDSNDVDTMQDTRGRVGRWRRRQLLP